MKKESLEAAAEGNEKSTEDKEKKEDSGKPEQPKIKSINDIIEESKNPEALAIKEKIDAVKKDKFNLMLEVKGLRRRLNYKLTEGEAISKFVNDENNQIDPKKFAYLKKLKNKLEFKLSTEARISLYEEKDIIRKINIISTQLNDLYKFQRLKRKSGYIVKDIEELKTKINEDNNKIANLNKSLDDLYDQVRRILKINRRNAERKPGESQAPKRKFIPQATQEINLEDIAVIKKK